MRYRVVLGPKNICEDGQIAYLFGKAVPLGIYEGSQTDTETTLLCIE